MAEIRLSAINKVYPDGTHAVHDVDLHIRDGEFMIMVGPSGCAKSTILRMIAGLEVPTSGTIEIGGRVVNDMAPKDRDIAMVFQSYALYPHMTVADNMAFGLKLRKMPPTEIEQRIQLAARILGLENLLHRRPKQLSGGQRQRVAMGRAIVREPQAFLMDEPLSNLDAKLRVQMRTEIAKLHQRLNTTTVYVTHDQVEAMTLGQRICILRKGVVQQVDTPYMVYTNPANIFVGGFIGSPGMNFVEGTLLMQDGAVYLKTGEYVMPLPAEIVSRLTVNDIDGRPVHVGIRPEHMRESAGQIPGRPMLPATIELIEAMGSEAFAYFTWPVSLPNLSELADAQGSGGTPTFVAKIDASTRASTGDIIWMELNLNEVHLFDPHSMVTLLTPRAEDLTDIHFPIPKEGIEIAPAYAGHEIPMYDAVPHAIPVATAWADASVAAQTPITFPSGTGPYARPERINASDEMTIPRPRFVQQTPQQPANTAKPLLPPPTAGFGSPDFTTGSAVQPNRTAAPSPIRVSGSTGPLNLFQNRPKLEFKPLANKAPESDS